MKLIITNLTKEYSSKKVGLSDYSLDITAGVIGLLGPNGAGKSTLLKMISTFTRPTSGSILLNGVDIVKRPDEMRKVLGFLPQNFGVYPNLTPYEFLEYLAAMKGVGGRGLKLRIEALLEGVNLIDVANKPLGTFSGGMVQRVGIAQTLINDPKVLIFDEPTVGLDPEERLRFRDLISDLSQDRIVILSSHIVSDLESLADEIAVMADGKLITKGPVEALITETNGCVFETRMQRETLKSFKVNHKIVSSKRKGSEYSVRYVTETAQSPDSQAVAPTLEDAYILLTQQK